PERGLTCRSADRPVLRLTVRGRRAGRGRAAGTGAAGTGRGGADDAGRAGGGREGGHRPGYAPRRRLAVPPRRDHPVPAAGGRARLILPVRAPGAFDTCHAASIPGGTT